MEISLLLLLALCSALTADAARRPTEQERAREWYKRNITWPPTWQPETEKYKENMLKREQELQMIPGANERWENYMQFTAARMVPRFTEKGFDIIPTPPEIQAELKLAVDQALLRWEYVRNETKIDALYTPIPSKFIHLGNGAYRRIQSALQPLHEEWAGGMKLKPTSIYGIRMNRNGSSLVMHYDKIETHVISSIIHIDHEYFDDDEPWPIEIEDHDGELHAFNLEPGQMLLYESASCLHGRRKILKGKHYSSIFNHYRPADKSLWDFTINEVIANVPPHWSNGIIEDQGSRWAGQGLTIDSRVSDAAPPRIIRGKVISNIGEYYNRMEL